MSVIHALLILLRTGPPAATPLWATFHRCTNSMRTLAFQGTSPHRDRVGHRTWSSLKFATTTRR